MTKLFLTSTFDKFFEKNPTRFNHLLAARNIVCIPTAAYAYDTYDWLESEKEPIRKRAGKFREFDITGKSSEEVSEALKEADIVYVTGGNTYYLLEHMQKCNFGRILNECFERGACYAGSSAGAVIVCPRIDHIEDMDDPSKGKPEGFKGLNLTDFLLMPHTDHEVYGQRARDIILRLKNEKEKIIGLRDDQGIGIENNYLEVY